jgi:NodT family efflux transporter outer membrane factor (OMF) lipoprotein
MRNQTMTRLRPILVSTLALAAAACASGPNYVRPATPTTAAGPFLSANTPALDPSAQVQGDWWRLYRDPVLDRLVADALAANTDVRVAIARLARARASLREVRGERAPQLSVNGGADYARAPLGQTLPGASRENWSFDAGVSVAYEVDLFGRASRGVEAARGEVGAADADVAAVRVLVAAETARAYADAASAAERQSVAEHMVALLDKSLALTEKRHTVGLTTGLDVARIASLRDQRRAEVPSLLAERQAALFRLAMLTGRTPADLPPEAGARRETLRLDSPIPVGDGAALLARRPDVRAAERRLAASTARIGVATADLYPRISLGGSFGSTASKLGDLVTGGPVHWLLGSLLSWTVNRGPARARIAEAQADSQAALATFDGTVLRALQETETALSAYTNLLDRRTALASARDQAERAAAITRARQREGDINSLELLDTERTLADAQAAVAEADARIADAQVDLFRALGGGWQPAARS